MGVFKAGSVHVCSNTEDCVATFPCRVTSDTEVAGADTGECFRAFSGIIRRRKCSGRTHAEAVVVVARVTVKRRVDVWIAGQIIYVGIAAADELGEAVSSMTAYAIVGVLTGQESIGAASGTPAVR